MDKSSLRNQIKERKKLLTSVEKQKASNTIFKYLESLDVFRSSESILCYWSLPDELNTHDFINKWFRQKKIYLPIIKDNEIKLVLYTGLGNMKAGAYEILEPIGSNLSNLNEIEMAIVPGIAFSAEGHRMGRGGGYYDRFLPLLKNAFTVGVAYYIQNIESVPVEKHDVKLDKVMFG